MENEKGNENGKENGSRKKIPWGDSITKGRSYRRKITTLRDVQFLKFCFEQYFIQRDQFKDWLIENYGLKNEAVAKTVMIRMLQLLQHEGLIKPFRSIRFGFEEAYFVTTKGIRFLGERIPKKSAFTPIDEQKLRHDADVTAIRMAWERTTPMIRWIPERTLRDGGKKEVPDAVVVAELFPEGCTVKIAIEVENTLKSRKRYVGKCRDYKHSRYDFVFYFVGDKEIGNAILESCRDITDKIHVCLGIEFLKHGGATKIMSLKDVFTIKNRFYGKLRRRKTETTWDDWDCNWQEWGCQ
jgi:hypothetical protein